MGSLIFVTSLSSDISVNFGGVKFESNVLENKASYHQRVLPLWEVLKMFELQLQLYLLKTVLQETGPQNSNC